jgi:hypothetical protein
LIQKVKNRINDWRNKTLSFAGRLQLISSVLTSIHVYWASMFLLPNHVCDSIDKLCKKFYGLVGVRVVVLLVYIME